MKGMICNRCGSLETRSVNCGFDGLFLVLWLAAGAAWFLHLYTLAFLSGLVAVVYSVIALFRWREVCRACESRDLLPADSPVGRRLRAALSAD